MRRILLVIIIVNLFSCRNEVNDNTAASRADTATVPGNEDDNTSGNRSFLGTWSAHVERISTTKADSLKLIVIGSMEPERQGAKVILMKEDKLQARPDELVLNLSKRPIKKMNMPVTVNYTEFLKTQGQYKKVFILYRNDTIAILNNVSIVKNKIAL